MLDLDGLSRRYEVLAGELLKIVREGKRLLVVTHIDADGLASGAMAFAALRRQGADVVLRTVPDLDRRAIAELKEQEYDFYLLTDLGSSLVSDLEDAFDGRFLLIDHHQLGEKDVGRPEVVNAWQYGMDGGKDACSSSMASMFARAFGEVDDLSYLAVVGALADRQDVGEGRSLVGLNRVALELAQKAGLVRVSKDLLFSGRETRPVHEAIALTSSPFLPGVSGSKDAVLAALLQAGVVLREQGRWRAISELTQEEKMKIMEVVASLISAGGGATDALASLVGDVYSLELEDRFTPLRDAREFGTLLNACGRMGESGIGLALCLGDRGEALKAALRILADYRLSLSKALDGVLAQATRVEEHGGVVLIRGAGLIDEKLLGPVASILTSSLRFKDKVIVAMTDSGEGQLKISCRLGDSYSGSANLGIVMKEAADAVNGVGGGHGSAAGAKIPSMQAEPFTKLVLEKMVAP